MTEEALQSFLGPLGLTAFLLIVNLGLIKWHKRQEDFSREQTNERINKIEGALTPCKKSHDALMGKYTELKQDYGYIKGRLETLEHLSPERIIAEVKDAIMLYRKAS